MELVNKTDSRNWTMEQKKNFIVMLSPLAPHLAEELWEQMGHSESVQMVDWPAYDEEILGSAMIIMPVQVNGKVRGTIEVAPGISQEEAEAAARDLPNVSKYLDTAEVKKVILVPDKLIGFVISNS